jgi:hypothetical protein
MRADKIRRLGEIFFSILSSEIEKFKNIYHREHRGHRDRKGKKTITRFPQMIRVSALIINVF